MGGLRQKLQSLTGDKPGVGWETGDSAERELSGERTRAARSEGEGSLHSVRAKGSETSQLIFDGPLLARAELTGKQVVPALCRRWHQAGWEQQEAGILCSRPAAHLGKALGLACTTSSSSASPREQGKAQMPAPPHLLRAAKAATFLQK